MPYGFNDDKSKHDLSDFAQLDSNGKISVTNLPNIPADNLPNIPANKVTGELAASNLPIIPADKLTADNIPGLPASKITSGILPVSRGGTGKGTATEARHNLGLSYGPGDTISGWVHTSGYVTRSGTFFEFDAPLNKVVDGNVSVNRITIKIRQEGYYIYGDGDNMQDVTSMAGVSKITSGLEITLSASTAPAHVVNNDTFLCVCYYSISVS